MVGIFHHKNESISDCGGCGGCGGGGGGGGGGSENGNKILAVITITSQRPAKVVFSEVKRHCPRNGGG
ncbi:Hypothetical predicted protein [Octopus vulgaris]|uniref:Uncharacterized protein n=1 Tax=Octopus vulgaris TaxID=6645 RepID=A0AA36B570_OCTVU|nr:Hypothetical predicted protein [Octopus vulgaris]